MATGITANAATKIKNEIANYRSALYRNNILTNLSSTPEFNQAVKGENAKKAFTDASRAIQSSIDNYTKSLQTQLENSIQNINTNYVKQDETATTFVNLKNKYKS